MPTLDYKKDTPLQKALKDKMPAPMKEPGQALMEKDAKAIMDKLQKMFDEA